MWHMHVCGTGAIWLYIQLAPWRYSTDTFGVRVQLGFRHKHYNWFQEQEKSAQFNTYYYSVDSLFEVSASPVPSRTPVVLRYLLSKP